MNVNILGAKPGIIVNGNYDCKIGHLNLSCVPVVCDSIFISTGDTIQFCTDSVVDLISDSAYYIQWNFTGSSNYPLPITDHYPISHGICRVPIWNTPGSYIIEVFYNGWLTAYPNSDCYAQGPSHWIIKVNVSGTNGIKDQSAMQKVNVFPNPANDKLNIDLSIGGKGILEIYSLPGEKVQSDLLKNGMNSISLENLDRGIYFLKISSENETITRKIVKE